MNDGDVATAAVVSARDLVVRRGRFVLDVPAFAGGAAGTAVLGPNGAGKTTLLLALQRLVPYAGDVRTPARTAGVFARPAVLRGTVAWNVAAVVAPVLGTSARDADVRARRALEDVGLGALLRADARTLSTGERQRLAIARALAVEPDAVFLDEPLANVDPDARPQLRALLRDYAARSGCAITLVTSSLADARALCSRAVVLRDGRIAVDDAMAELATSNDRFVQALIAELKSP